MKKVSVITMGCSKNLVDSEMLLHRFKSNGYSVEHDPDTITGQIVVVNTCGFIGDAKEESVNMILDLANAKQNGQIEKLYVMGCLSERYLNELSTEIPEVDKYYGKFDWDNLLMEISDNKLLKHPTSSDRYITTPKHYAYLKISEGCNRSCAFCAIPIITGKHKSKPINELVEETEKLAQKGVKELQVIAQDLSYYGVDLYKKPMLAELITELSKIEGIEWIRLHYAYPAGFPDDILKVINENPKVCKYLDIALQHISDPVLERMKRHFTKEQTYNLIDKIRDKVPGIHLRTTLLTGFPGETEESFNELKEFVVKCQFERLGVFPYSEEEGTFAGDNYSDEIPQEVKEQRQEELMLLQQDIALAHNKNKIGKTLKVIIDRKEDKYYIGRTEYDSPEVDPEVIVEGKNLKIGEFYMVTVTAADIYELSAKVI